MAEKPGFPGVILIRKNTTLSGMAWMKSCCGMRPGEHDLVRSIWYKDCVSSGSSSAVLPGHPRPVSTLCNGPWADTVVFPTLWSVNVSYEREKAWEERRWVRRPGLSNLLNRKAWQWRKWGYETVHLHIRVPPAVALFFMCKKVKIIIKTLLVLECITAFPEAWWGAFEKPREMVAWRPATFIHEGAWASYPHSCTLRTNRPARESNRGWVFRQSVF